MPVMGVGVAGKEGNTANGSRKSGLEIALPVT